MKLTKELFALKFFHIMHIENEIRQCCRSWRSCSTYAGDEAPTQRRTVPQDYYTLKQAKFQ